MNIFQQSGALKVSALVKQPRNGSISGIGFGMVLISLTEKMTIGFLITNTFRVEQDSTQTTLQHNAQTQTYWKE